jgi:hypothetical protein
MIIIIIFIMIVLMLPCHPATGSERTWDVPQTTAVTNAQLCLAVAVPAQCSTQVTHAVTAHTGDNMQKPPAHQQPR